MTTEEIERWLWDQAQAAAELWNREQRRDMFASLYLYHKPGNLTVCGNTVPDGFELADGRRLCPSGTIEQIRNRIYEVSRRLPILTPEMVNSPKKGKR